MPPLSKREKKDIPGVWLHHGDCLKILPNLTDNSVDLVWTDPPFGHNNNDGDLIHNWEAALGRGVVKTEDARPIHNDSPEETSRVFRGMLPHLPRLLRTDGCCCCCCCGGGGPDPQFARWSLWLDEVLNFKMAVCWDKGPMGMGWHYRRSYEFVLVAQKGNSCKWYDDSCRIENIIRPGNYGIRKIIPREEQHPTLKPVELAEHFIRLHTQPGDIILDPFMGAGTTGVAAVRNGRGFIGIEMDDHWFGVAKKSIEEEMRLAGKELNRDPIFA